MGNAVERARWHCQSDLYHPNRQASRRGACVCEKDPKDAALRIGPRGTTSEGDRRMTSLAKLRQNLLKDPDVRAEYDRLGPIFAVVGEMVEARQTAGLTQAEIAKRMGTSQSVIARLENARHMPTFDMVSRYAAAIGRRIDIHLVLNG